MVLFYLDQYREGCGGVEAKHVVLRGVDGVHGGYKRERRCLRDYASFLRNSRRVTRPASM